VGASMTVADSWLLLLLDDDEVVVVLILDDKDDDDDVCVCENPWQAEAQRAMQNASTSKGDSFVG